MISICLFFAATDLFGDFACWSKDQHGRLLSELLILNAYQQVIKNQHTIQIVLLNSQCPLHHQILTR